MEGVKTLSSILADLGAKRAGEGAEFPARPTEPLGKRCN